MAEFTAARNNALPYPVYGLPYVVTFPLLDADGDPTSPSSPDSEISKNGDTFSDCTNEAVEIATSSGICYLSLTGTELTTDIATVRIQSTGAKTTVLALYPRKLVSIRAGTSASAGSSTSTIVLDASASAVDDFYNGMIVAAVIDSVTEVRMITDYTGSTQTATVTPDWNTAPDNNDTFTVYRPDGVQIQQANVTHLNSTAQTARDIGASVLLSSGTGTGQLNFTSGVVSANVTQFGGSNGTFSSGRPEVNTSHAAGTAWNSGAIGASTLASDTIAAAKIATGAITSAKFAAGAIDAAAIANGAIDAATFAADVDAEILSYLVDDATRIDASALNTLSSHDPGEVIMGTTDLATTVDQVAAIKAVIAPVSVGVVDNTGATSSIFRTNLTQVDDYWNDALLVITSGDMIGQSKPILDFANTNGVITLSEALTAAPANGVTFSITATHIHPVTQIAAGVRTELTTELGRIDVASSTLATAANLTTVAGYLDTEVAAILEDTGTTIPAQIAALNNITAASVWAVGTRTLTAGTNIDGSTFTGIPWNASWDAEVQSEVDDALVAQRLDELLNADSDIDGAAPPTVGSVFHELMSKTAGSFTFDQTTDSNEAIRDRGDAAWITATGFSTHSAADAAAAVLDVAIAGHLGAGTVGDAIYVAATRTVSTHSAADVWASATRTLTSLSGLTVDTVTTLMNLPAITAGWLTASGIAADALNGKGDWLLSGGYTAPDNASIAAILEDTGTTLQAELDGIQADTEDIQSRLPAELTAQGMMKSDMMFVQTQAQTAGNIYQVLSAMFTNVGTAAAVRAAVGLGSANLDTQLADLPTVTEMEARTLIAASYATAANLAIVAGYIDTEVAAIKARTDNLPDSPAAVGSSMTLTGGTVASIAVASAAVVTSDHGAGSYARNTEPATASEVAIAVVDQTLAGHTTAGTVGGAVAASGSSGDPWSTVLPGDYDAGTAGRIIGDMIDAAISSRLAAADYTAPENPSDYARNDVAPDWYDSSGGSLTAEEVWAYENRNLTASALDAILVADNLTSGRYVDTDGNPVTQLNLRQAVALLLAASAGDRSGIGTREIIAKLAGASPQVQATRTSQSVIEGSGVVPV